ncbi:MAG: DnaJ domain-containing protein, partial [Nitrospinales bacterium]
MSKVQQRDLYEVLRVRPDATQREIAQAYRSRVQLLSEVGRRQRSFLDEASREEQFALIQEAYETLFNKEKRGAYDRFN